jgi:prophage regulatory protein
MMRYLTLLQLSEKLGNRSRSSIYRDVEQGRLPIPMKFGARVYFDETEVEAAVAAQRTKAPGTH